MIIWIIGLSGAGKTAIGREVYKAIKQKNPATVFIDGDEVRAIFKNDRHDQDYSVEGRKKNAERMREICRWLDGQDIDVVCCILSIFEESHRRNRDDFSRYYEIFIDAPFEDLVARNPKNLYELALAGKIQNVVGVDIEFTRPANPDLIIQNPRPFTAPKEKAAAVLSYISARENCNGA